MSWQVWYDNLDPSCLEEEANDAAYEKLVDYYAERILNEEMYER